MGFGHRHCAVLGCTNSRKKLNKLSKMLCSIHSCAKLSCECSPAFILYPFPTESKDKDRKYRWARLIKRQNKNGSMWLPNKLSRVCSKHFIDREPTKENPDPILKMGYEIQVKPKRKSPVCREFVPTKRKRRQLVNEETLVAETTQTEPTTETEPTAADGHKSVLNQPTRQMEGVAGFQDKSCLETSSSVSADQEKCCEKSNNITLELIWLKIKRKM